MKTTTHALILQVPADDAVCVCVLSFSTRGGCAHMCVPVRKSKELKVERKVHRQAKQTDTHRHTDTDTMQPNRVVVKRDFGHAIVGPLRGPFLVVCIVHNHTCVRRAHRLFADKNKNKEQGARGKEQGRVQVELEGNKQQRAATEREKETYAMPGFASQMAASAAGKTSDKADEWSRSPTPTLEERRHSKAKQSKVIEERKVAGITNQTHTQKKAKNADLVPLHFMLSCYNTSKLSKKGRFRPQKKKRVWL